MQFGTVLRRFNPLKVDVRALSEPKFDPRKQSWLLAELAAIEVIAGGFLSVPFLLVAVGTHGLLTILF